MDGRHSGGFDLDMATFPMLVPPTIVGSVSAQQIHQLLVAAGVGTKIEDWVDDSGKQIPYLVIDQHVVEPFDEPGVLVVDGDLLYSDLWL